MSGQIGQCGVTAFADHSRSLAHLAGWVVQSPPTNKPHEAESQYRNFPRRVDALLRRNAFRAHTRGRGRVTARQAADRRHLAVPALQVLDDPERGRLALEPAGGSAEVTYKAHARLGRFYLALVALLLITTTWGLFDIHERFKYVVTVQAVVLIVRVFVMWDRWKL